MYKITISSDNYQLKRKLYETEKSFKKWETKHRGKYWMYDIKTFKMGENGWQELNFYPEKTAAEAFENGI